MIVPCPNPTPSSICIGDDFDEDSGTGILTKVGELTEEICPPCGLPTVVEELMRRREDLDRFRELFPTINFSEIEALLTAHPTSAIPKATLWMRIHGFALSKPMPEHFRQAEASLVQAYEDSRRAFWRMREVPFEDGLHQARAFIGRSPTEISQDPTQMERLMELRRQAQEAIATAERNFEATKQRIRWDRKARLLKKGHKNVRAAMSLSRRYLAAKTQINEEGERKREEELVERLVSTVIPVDGEEAEGAPTEKGAPIEEMEGDEEAEG